MHDDGRARLCLACEGYGYGVSYGGWAGYEEAQLEVTCAACDGRGVVFGLRAAHPEPVDSMTEERARTWARDLVRVAREGGLLSGAE